MAFQQAQVIHEGGQADSHQDHSGPIIVLFIFIGLLLGGLLREVNKKTKIPYTPMLLVLGIFLGFFRNHLGVIGQSTTIIEKLNAHMILLIFIPVLIFESAFNCDWHVFRKSMFNIIVLAGPGVLWGAILIGVTFKIILRYPDNQLTWYQSFTLGSVLSATDPVAVVALLKELGASVRFNTLVEGESLLNDGTAMVFFMLFMDLAKGNSSSAFGVLTNFVRIAFGGPLLGIIFGIILSYWLKRIIRDNVLSVNITFIGAYLCFYVAEFTWVKVSGILSIVVLGLYMSAVGKRKIYPQSQQALHNVWQYIQYSCETLIFILTGVVAGVEMIESSTITGMDWFRMFVFWVLMILLRAIMVLTFYPLLKRSGYGLTKKQLVVLIYGGLRGALGLCLSLIISVDSQLPIRFRQITVFYMCGMALLTIIVNGLTCAKVVSYVEMIHYPQIKRKMLKRCIREVLQSTQHKMTELKTDPDLAYAKWKQVERLADTKKLGQIEHQRRSHAQIRDSIVDIRKNQMIEQIRFRFTRYLRKLYWEYYQQGQVSQESIQILSDSCDIVNDDCTQRLNYYDILSSNFTMETMKYYLYFKDSSIIGGYVTRMMVSKIYFVYEVSIVFLEAAEQSLHVFQHQFPLSNEYLNYVLDQVKDNVEHAISYINQIENNYPTVIQAVHTSRASTILLKQKKNTLKEMHQQGFIDDGDYQNLRKQIDRNLVNVHFTDFKLEEVQFNQILIQCPLFSSLSTQDIVNIRMKSVERLFEKGSKIISKGKEITVIYIIISGSVKEQFDNFYLIRGIGNVLNPYDFTYNQVSKCNVKASTNLKVIQIKPEVIKELMNAKVQFKKRWYKSLFIYSINLGKNMEFLEKNFTQKEMRRFIEASEVKIMRAGQLLSCEQGAYVFEGQVQCQGNTYMRGNFLSQMSSAKALTESILLKFNEVIGINFKSSDRISVFNEKLD